MVMGEPESEKLLASPKGFVAVFDPDGKFTERVNLSIITEFGKSGVQVLPFGGPRLNGGTTTTNTRPRIKGAEIVVPPLRERRDDIPRLVQHFAGRFAAELGKPVPTITEPAMMRLVAYPWPGNVRELLNVVQRMMVMSDGQSVDVRHVPDEIRSPEGDDSSTIGSLAGVGLDKLEKEAIRQTLAMTGGNREQAAHLLGIGERTLYRVIQDWKLQDQIRGALSRANGDLEEAADATRAAWAVFERIGAVPDAAYARDLLAEPA